MKQLLEMSERINLLKIDCDHLQCCEICIRAKQTRLPFNTVRQRATRALELIHTDLCGPIDPPTWDGKR